MLQAWADLLDPQRLDASVDSAGDSARRSALPAGFELEGSHENRPAGTDLDNHKRRGEQEPQLLQVAAANGQAIQLEHFLHAKQTNISGCGRTNGHGK